MNRNVETRFSCGPTAIASALHGKPEAIAYFHSIFDLQQVAFREVIDVFPGDEPTHSSIEVNRDRKIAAELRILVPVVEELDAVIWGDESLPLDEAILRDESNVTGGPGLASFSKEFRCPLLGFLPVKHQFVLMRK
ncbi:hypothetical protein ACFXG6_24535 [Streptomyces roseus]|uniref:hypothetical protein n=1 Tax=Streptomyces roseus TaxID=66430 RepID=UPI0036A3E247